jgi:hypothetical protein
MTQHLGQPARQAQVAVDLPDVHERPAVPTGASGDQAGPFQLVQGLAQRRAADRHEPCELALVRQPLSWVGT